MEIESTPHISDSSVSTHADQGIADQGLTDQQNSTDSDGMTDEETVDDIEHVDSIDEGPIATRLPKRNVGAPKRITDDMVAYALPIVEEGIPSTYSEAMQSCECDQWKVAMDE